MAGILKRLRKGVKKRKRKTKQKAAKRKIKRKKRKAVREDFASDVSELFEASRAGEAVRGARRAGSVTVLAAKKGGKAIDKAAEAITPHGTLTSEVKSGDISVSDLKTDLTLVNDRNSLKRLLRAERSGKNRSSAKKAIRARLKDLEANGEETARSETVGDVLGVSAPDEPMFGGGGEPVMEPMFGGGDDDDDGGERDSFGLDF